MKKILSFALCVIMVLTAAMHVSAAPCKVTGTWGKSNDGTDIANVVTLQEGKNVLTLPQGGKNKYCAFDFIPDKEGFYEVRLRNIKSDKVKYPSVRVSAYKCIKRLAPDMYKFGIFHIYNPKKEIVSLNLQNKAFLCNQALPWTSDWIGGFECNNLTDFEKLRLVFYNVSDYVRKDNKNIQTNQSVQLVVEVNFWGDIYEEEFFYVH